MPLLSSGRDELGGGGAILRIWPFDVALGNVLADLLRIFVANILLTNCSVVLDL